MACQEPNEYPDYIDETFLTSYTASLKKVGGDEYAESILSLYLIYCEIGKLCLCVHCARKFLREREELIGKYGGEMRELRL
jgi:hypothetical protein